MHLYKTLLTFHRCSQEVTGQVFTVGSIEALEAIEAYTPGTGPGTTEHQSLSHSFLTILCRTNFNMVKLSNN